MAGQQHGPVTHTSQVSLTLLGQQKLRQFVRQLNWLYLPQLVC